MARRRRPARSRHRKTKASYRHGLKDAIRKWLPAQFFSQWSKKAKWTAQRTFWMAILMTWSVEQTLATRFEATRDVLRRLFPKWRLGKNLHRLVRGPGEMADTVEAGLDQASAAADAGDGGWLLDARRLVCVRGGWLAGRMSSRA